MSRYSIHKFDWQTYVVFDQIKKREICVCSWFEPGGCRPLSRARMIAQLLNQQVEKPTLSAQS